jgi:hypothetical protein
MNKKMGQVYTRQFGWSVGHPTSTGSVLFVQPSDFGASFEMSGIALSAGRVSCVTTLARSGGEAYVGCPTEALCLHLYNSANSADKRSSCFAHDDG